jgi:hypothetical protein
MTSVWRTLIRSIGIDPSLFDLVCDFMGYILERFPTRAITKRVSQTARAIIPASHSDSELISVLVDRPFFTTFINHLDTALSGPPDERDYGGLRSLVSLRARCGWQQNVETHKSFD